jgi:hypothetical protein
MTKGKTITTYLVDGNPKGIRTCFISNKICKAVVVPRVSLSDAKRRSELQQPALYILLSDVEDKTYIGETEDFLARIKHHESNKSFWEEAIVFVSKDNDLTKSDVKYLEYLAIQRARETARYSVAENKVSPKPTNLPEHQLAFVESFFEDVCILASFLGVPVFDKVKRQNRALFYCKIKGIEARGFYSESGFTVLKGSAIRKQAMPSFSAKESRDAKIAEAATSVNETTVVLHKDLTFKSPSAASSFCRGNASNGWVDWVNEKGQSLDEVYRNHEVGVLEGGL